MQYCEDCWAYNIPDDYMECPICGSEDMWDADDRFDPDVWSGGEGYDYERSS